MALITRIGHDLKDTSEYYSENIIIYHRETVAFYRKSEISLKACIRHAFKANSSYLPESQACDSA